MKLITGNDKAKEEKFKNHRDRMVGLPARIKGLPAWDGSTTDQDPVLARVDFGRWLADCECGGAEYVDPEYKYFFCFSCGNKNDNGSARRVIFPNDQTMEDIQAELIKRPVIERAGKSASAAALHSIPAMAGLSRSWNPGETVTDLKKQRDRALARAGIGRNK